MSTDNNCFFCNTTCKVDVIPSLSCTSKYSCEYCGEYLLDPEDSRKLSGQTDNRFKIACVLNERRLRKLGGIALNDKTDVKDKVLGLPRISVDDILDEFPKKASDFLDKALLNLSLLTKPTQPYGIIRLDLANKGDCLHLFTRDKQGCYTFLRELSNQGYIRFNRVPAGEQWDVFSLTTKCWEKIENLQQEIHNSSNDGNTSIEWDVFICHASEDKKDFVRPLANALTKAGVKVWYDRFELKLGDSLRRKIDQGLSNSRYGVVVLSKAFFNKEWPQKELDGLTALEINGRKVILPVWHNIEVDVVRKYSPTLADRVATKSKKGINRVIIDILEAIGHTLTNDISSSLTNKSNENHQRQKSKPETEGNLNKVKNMVMGMLKEMKNSKSTGNKRDVVKKRIESAIEVVGLKDSISYVLVSYPDTEMEIRGLFESRTTDVVKLIDEPPKLRHAGFDISTEERSRIINGELRRCVLKSYKLLEVWRDGAVVFIVDGDEGFLCWGDYNREKFLRINPIALLESVYLFCLFVKDVFQRAEALDCQVQMELQVRNIPQERKYGLPTDKPGSFGWRYNRLDTIVWAQEPNLSVNNSWEWKNVAPEKGAYDLVSELYAKFGVEHEFIPYVKEQNGENVIDFEQITKLG